MLFRSRGVAWFASQPSVQARTPESLAQQLAANEHTIDNNYVTVGGTTDASPVPLEQLHVQYLDHGEVGETRGYISVLEDDTNNLTYRCRFSFSILLYKSIARSMYYPLIRRTPSRKSDPVSSGRVP